jgi:cation diffusion facilitator family transporter
MTSSESFDAHVKTRCAALSIISNSSLIVVKLVAGLVTGSVAVVSEAVHSFLDLMASFMAWGAVRVSDAPPDYDHPFGHGKTENLAALFEALLIVVGGLFIARESVLGLLEGRELPNLTAGLAVMLLSSVVNFLISRKLFRVGRALGSPALEADAWHLRTDVYTSLGIFGALLVIELGRAVNPAWNLVVIDSLCALVVSLLIVKTGFSLGWSAGANLIDRRLSGQELTLIEEHIRELFPKVYAFRRLRTRRSGPFRLVLVDLVVDGRLSVFEAHALGARIVGGIKVHYPNADVTFHLEPADVERLEKLRRERADSANRSDSLDKSERARAGEAHEGETHADAANLDSMAAERGGVSVGAEPDDD